MVHIPYALWLWVTVVRLGRRVNSGISDVGEVPSLTHSNMIDSKDEASCLTRKEISRGQALQCILLSDD